VITTVVAATKLAGFRELAIFIAELGTGATVVYFIIKESEIRSLRRKDMRETPAAAWAVTSAQIKFFALLRSLSFALRLSALGGSSYRFLAVAAVHGMVLHGFCANIGNQGWNPKKEVM